MEKVILDHSRVHLLMNKEYFCCRPVRNGERKDKSVGSCIVNVNLSAFRSQVGYCKKKKIEGDGYDILRLVNTIVSL
jgi:ribosomal protein S6E (S10)